MTPPDLRGRSLALTGASRGIGAALARGLLRAGARVALIARDQQRLSEVLADGDGVIVPADLTRADPEALVDRCRAELGGLDGFINCAGVVVYQASLSITEDALAHQLRMNFTQPLLLAQAAARTLCGQGGGDIISIVSTLAMRPAPMTAGYAASKAALVAATRAMALELGPHNVRVNAIAPGVVDTDMVRVPRLQSGEAPLDAQAAHARVEEQLDGLRKLHQLGRLGTPEDLVGALYYLLTSPFVTGTVLTVDGGLSLSRS